MSLAALRRRIDAVDGRILRLLEVRLALAVRTRAFKTAVIDRAREAEVLRSAGLRAGPLAGPELAARLYRQILARSRDLQRDLERRRKDHEDRHTRRGKDGGLARKGARPRARCRRP